MRHIQRHGDMAEPAVYTNTPAHCASWSVNASSAMRGHTCAAVAQGLRNTLAALRLFVVAMHQGDAVALRSQRCPNCTQWASLQHLSCTRCTVDKRYIFSSFLCYIPLG